MPRQKQLAHRRAKPKTALDTPSKKRLSLFPRSVRPHYSNKLSLNDLINAESALGRTLFGPIPAGHQREFFTARRNVWIWHERWTDQLGQLQEMTIRYEVRPSGVYKRPSGGKYQKIDGLELKNFRQAAQQYLKLVKQNLYS